VDDNGTRHRLVRELGRGGQGTVFEVEGGRLAAKIVFDRSPSRREALRNQLIQVKRLDLGGLAIARPIEMLREPHLGYLMTLLTGMQPIKALAVVPRSTASPTEWYAAGGGLRRRLELLARSADSLAALHGKGLAYADPSPHNLFVSESRDACEVCFIDADNLQYGSRPGGPAVYTPGYGAPELVRGTSGVTSLTDAHAFAVLAFQTLSLAHPLIGDAVADGSPEQEDRALAGDLSWIDHPTDDRNRSSNGIPRQRVLSPRLADLADKTFGRGLREATKRPGVAEWAERLHVAANATLRCAACQSSFYLGQPRCPWCDCAAPPYALATFGLWDPQAPQGQELMQKPTDHGLRPVNVGLIALTEHETVVVTRRSSEGCDGAAGAVPVAELRLEGVRVGVRCVDDVVRRLVSPSGSRTVEVTGREELLQIVPGQASWRLHFGEPQRLHRVVSFELRGAGAK
jgi:DNA-binding helix-hairpin-helix protein with protein kinase domain